MKLRKSDSQGGDVHGEILWEAVVGGETGEAGSRELAARDTKGQAHGMDGGRMSYTGYIWIRTVCCRK